MEIHTVELGSPIGRLTLYASATGVCGLAFDDAADRTQAQLTRRFPQASFRAVRRDPLGASEAMRAYLAGELGAIDALVVDAGGTAFQAEVWQALRRIPCGTTISYMELAKRIGRPAAVRAVGAANGANPVAIIVPCHRVVAADGNLHGYGGGLPRKQWLLVHERALLA